MFGRPLSGHGPSGQLVAVDAPMADDRQFRSEDRRSVNLRVRAPPTGTPQCHRVTPTGRGMMLTVKLMKTRRTDPQDDGLESCCEPGMLG